MVSDRGRYAIQLLHFTFRTDVRTVASHETQELTRRIQLQWVLRGYLRSWTDGCRGCGDGGEVGKHSFGRWPFRRFLLPTLFHQFPGPTPEPDLFCVTWFGRSLPFHNVVKYFDKWPLP